MKSKNVPEVQNKRNEIGDFFKREKTVLKDATWVIKCGTIITSGNRKCTLTTHDNKSFHNQKSNHLGLIA